jgi:hypothetical protein
MDILHYGGYDDNAPHYANDHLNENLNALRRFLQVFVKPWPA